MHVKSIYLMPVLQSGLFVLGSYFTFCVCIILSDFIWCLSL